MYNRTFFGTQLGKASLASIAAMAAMIALTSQMNLVAETAAVAQPTGEAGYAVTELA